MTYVLLYWERWESEINPSVILWTQILWATLPLGSYFRKRSVYLHFWNTLNVDMPASAQMIESPKNTNTMNGRMRAEGRVTHPSRSTPTEHRYVTMMKGDEEWRCFDEEQWRTTKDNKLYNRTIVLRLNNVMTIGQLWVQCSLEELWDEGETNLYSVKSKPIIYTKL